LHRKEFHVLAQLIEDGRRDDAAAESARLAARDGAFASLDARLSFGS
jgi:1,4-alpha-glucan branching enzyme